MCFHLFTNSLNYNKTHKFNANEQSSRIKTPSKTNKVKCVFIYLQTLQTITKSIS